MGQAGLIIRAGNESDRALLEDMIADCYATVYPGWYEADILADALPAMLRIDPALLGSGHYFVAEMDNVIAGCGGWSARKPGTSESAAAVGHIRHFATRTGYMGKGVGGAILEHCATEASNHGVEKLQCFSSLAAETFYARHGFGKLQEVNVMLGGEAVFPAVLMEKALG